MKLINLFTRIPKSIALDPRLITIEKIYYAKLLDLIDSNGMVIIYRKISASERYIFRRLKHIKFIESYTETERMTTVKVNLKRD